MHFLLAFEEGLIALFGLSLYIYNSKRNLYDFRHTHTHAHIQLLQFIAVLHFCR